MFFGIELACAAPNQIGNYIYYITIRISSVWKCMDWDIRRIRAGTNVKIQTWENHEFRRCYCTPAWYWRNSFVDVGFMWAGNRCSRGTQGIRQSRWFWPSRESWICGILDLYDLDPFLWHENVLPATPAMPWLMRWFQSGNQFRCHLLLTCWWEWVVIQSQLHTSHHHMR